ncbi:MULTISPECIES: hypothetical protein [unclassified Streptomyces]|jgi:hypothetical protein|uniref:hypothetical protein n=1 Tax=unclassified Streptomyces TaxID=2593676 RepID=UPI0033A7BB38
MSDDYRPEGFEDSDAPLPRDMPDQQAGAEEETSPEQDSPDRAAGQGRDAEQSEKTGEDVPDTDEAGAHRRGAPGDEGGPPGTPTPDESTG